MVNACVDVENGMYIYMELCDARARCFHPPRTDVTHTHTNTKIAYVCVRRMRIFTRKKNEQTNGNQERELGMRTVGGKGVVLKICCTCVVADSEPDSEDWFDGGEYASVPRAEPGGVGGAGALHETRMCGGGFFCVVFRIPADMKYVYYSMVRECVYICVRVVDD